MRGGRLGFWVVCGWVGLVVAGTGVSAQSLTNEGFEAGLAGWETFGPGWRTSSFSNDAGSDAHGGSIGLVNDIQPADKDEWRGVSQVVEATHGMVFSGSVWIRGLNVKDGEAFLEFQFKDNDGKILEFKQSDPVTDDQPFTQVTIETAEPPKKTETLCIRGVVHMTRPPDKETDFFGFDDFSLSVTNKASKSGHGNKRPTVEERMKKLQSQQP
jgi:hypothetical protein